MAHGHPVNPVILSEILRFAAARTPAAVSLARRRVSTLRLLALEYLEGSGKNV
jgi:hypothetical protein